MIIPALNEEALIETCLDSVFAAVDFCRRAQPQTHVEVLLVDNGSSDGTLRTASSIAGNDRLTLLHCPLRSAAAARNLGARHAGGDVLVFLDADTLIAPDSLARISHIMESGDYEGGFAWLASREGGMRGSLWWSSWSHIRRLPVSRAKAMSALVFCSRDAFDNFGPFVATRELGEEWQLLGGMYRAAPERFYYDRSLVAYTSNRRMEMQRWGYLRTAILYLAVILIPARFSRFRYRYDLRETATNEH